MKHSRHAQPWLLIGAALLTIGTGVAVVGPHTVAAQATHYALESADHLRLHNLTAEPASLQGKKGLRLTASQDVLRRLEGMTPEEEARVQYLAVIDNVAFADGVIEVEVAGEPAPGASEGARGFVGIAFRVQEELRTFDSFYLRPTNGRAEDQERRNHTVQYASHPDWPWFRLRKETPSKYEAYVDMVPGVWTKLRIEVRGDRGRLFVHDQKQPTLIVNDLKSRTHGTGAVALTSHASTVAHFRSLTVQPLPGTKEMK
jgi:hypothetical protein